MSAKILWASTAISAAGFAVFTALLKIIGGEPWLSLAITFVTCFYHFAMRLIVGLLFNVFMHNKADPSKNWYRLRPFEKKLYKKLNIKKLIGKLPTYDSELFSLKTHTPEEIAGAMCQAELVHTTIAVLSFLPMTAVRFFSSFWVFFLTSLAAAAFDTVFVIAQRYNRGRIMKIMEKNIAKPLTFENLWVILNLLKRLGKRE